MLTSRSVWMSLLLLVLTGVVKAHLHFIRLVVLAAAGLAGMYMVHLLAQDWTKIRPPRPAQAGRLIQAALKGISKRSITDEMMILDGETENEVPTFDAALLQDPLGCARKLVCTLATRPRKSLSREETNILAMVRSRGKSKMRREWEEAAQLGAKTRQESVCDSNYPKCFFSSRQLVKILRSF